ncbi:MAG: ammonia-forming cytochrome c nitrite reductase subunit c552 [Eggerthellaceae bacterium]|nr:ammonia-forming cytochrome c nitrite reductase subunit c552 [Eggerthellaceae bacterium]
MKRTKGLRLGKQTVVWGLALAAVVATVALAACSSPSTVSSSSASTEASSAAASSTEASASSATEEATSSSSASSSEITEKDVENAVKALVPDFKAPTKVPEADEFGVIHYDGWQDEYPLQVASYLENAYNVPGYKGEYAEITASEPDTTSVGDIKAGASDGKANYLDADNYPEIKVIGKGYGYAKYYTEPGGHTYSIWSIEHNGRLGDVRGGGTKGILACYACKTPQIHFDAENKGGAESWKLGEVTEHAASVGVELKKNDAGDELPGWKQSASNGADYYTENVSCANCHQNDNPTQANVVRADWKRVLGKAWESNSLDIPQSAMVCGQCHCDYSMALSQTDDEYNNGEPTSPYEADTDGTLSNISPEKALEFYDKHGIVDWTYASTGAKMLSIRHAEFEIYYVMDKGSKMRELGYNCADCHMPIKSEDGVAYHSHKWTSPLDDAELVKECDTCHTDTTKFVKDMQADIDGKNHELGMRYADFIHNFEALVATEQDDPANEGQKALLLDEAFAAENGIDADKLAKLQDIQRKVCYYWNLPAADNSEGAHNQALFNRMIDEGNKLLDEADKIIEEAGGKASSAKAFEEWNAEQAKAA